MSRYFSSAVRAASRWAWLFNGTTKDLASEVAAVEQAVQEIPELASQVTKGQIK